MKRILLLAAYTVLGMSIVVMICSCLTPNRGEFLFSLGLLCAAFFLWVISDTMGRPKRPKRLR